jgi:hypothetical protein
LCPEQLKSRAFEQNLEEFTRQTGRIEKKTHFCREQKKPEASVLVSMEKSSSVVQ